MGRVRVRHFVFLALIGLLVWPGVVGAQSQDRILVVDAAGLFGERLDEVETTAEWLQTSGADVRVRTVSSYGSAGNLDQYEMELEQNSPSWLGADGYRKNNLIVIIISLQDGGETGLYYGDHWEDVIGDHWNSLQSDVMNPRFREGDFAGGIIAGLEEIQRLIEKGATSEDGTGGSGMSLGSALLLATFVVVGALFALFFFINHRKSQARRAALRQKALLAKQAAASGINELIETVQMLAIKVDVTANRVAAEDGASLHSGLLEARRLTDRSSLAYSELSHSAGDPENPKLGEAELGAIEPEYRSVLENLRHAREAVKSVEGQIDVVRQTVDSFPGKVAAVDAAVEQAVLKQDALTQAGFNAGYVGDLVEKARATLDMAHDLASKKRFREAVEYADLAAAQAQQAVQAAQELPQKKNEAETAIPALAARIGQVKARIVEGRGLFEKLAGEYAETTWVPVRGNGTEAENRVSWTEGALEDARLAIEPERQEWHRALELVGTANGWLTEAESLVESISELEMNLMAARRDAPAEINAAQVDVAKAWEYINKYDEDIRESLEDDLRAAEGMNNAAAMELTLEKPDYLRVCKLAREANEAADRILAQARDEHEAAERLRTRAVSAIRDAHTKVTMVSRFVQVRHPFVQDRTRNLLVEAREALGQAESSVDANTQISLATRAESVADEAYSLAQRDVNSSSGVSLPGWGSSGGQSTQVNIPAILFSGSGWGGNRPWGSRPSTSKPSSSSRRSTSRPSASPRHGGGSTSWGSSGGSRGGGSSSRGGGSRGW